MLKMFKEVFNYRELLKNNVKKEIRGKYKNSILGVIWTFLNPLLQILVYATIFPLILKDAQEYYVIFVCVGLIPWTFFTSSISQSTFTIVGNANIVNKVYFPREILPISVVLSNTINFLISALIIVAFCFIYGLGITKYIIFFPIVLIVQVVLQLGFAFILSAVNVYFRDLEHFIGIFLQMMFYATPIVYAEDTIPKAFSWIMRLNPMAAIISGYRDIFYNQQMPDLIRLGKWFLVGIAVFVIGWLIFNKLQKGFAEEL